jgi:hypothetical protein
VITLNTKCEVKFCQEKKAWRLYNSNGESVDGASYQTKDEAVNAGRCHCEETGDELAIYNKNGELTSRRKINSRTGE